MCNIGGFVLYFLFLISVHLYLGQLQLSSFSHFFPSVGSENFYFVALRQNQTALVKCRYSPHIVFSKRPSAVPLCRDWMLCSFSSHQIYLPSNVRLCSYVCVCRCINIKENAFFFFAFVCSPPPPGGVCHSHWMQKENSRLLRRLVWSVVSRSLNL